MFSIHRKLLLAFKQVRTVDSSKSLLLKFPSPGKRIPPSPSRISDSPSTHWGGFTTPTPYRYLENLAHSHQFNACVTGCVCSLCYLGCIVVNINALFAEWRIPEWDWFQILLLGILSGMKPTFYFQICCDGQFPCFVKYIFPERQTCSADCTECSCSSNIPSNFEQLLSF